MAPKTPKPTPSAAASYGPATAANNAITPTKVPTPKATATPTEKPTTPAAPGTGVVDPIKDLPKGIQKDYKFFIDGSYVLNSGGTLGGVQQQPYVSAVPTSSNTQPKAVIVLPKFNADGQQYGFTVTDIDKEVETIISKIPRANITFYKTQLKDLYPSVSDYKKSLTAGPITDKDIGFQQAIKNSLLQASVDNFNTGVEIAQKEARGEKSLAKMYSFESYVQTRTPTAMPTSQSQRTSGLTVKEDAYAEFDRTVKQYVGDPVLVNEVKKLREEYWQRLHKAELSRQSTGTSTTDIFGNTIGQTIAYTQMSEQDRLDLRLGLVVNGASVTDPKTKQKVVLSTGITMTSSEDLEEAGALIGASYGKLRAVAADYGIELTHTDLLNRSRKAVKPGSVTTGISPDAMGTGLEQEANSIKQAAKIKFKTLAPYIDQGLKVTDIASNFQRIKENEYGLVNNSVNIYDTDVQNAISGDKIYSNNDFILTVRAKPEWRKTPKANEMAATFINKLLTTWGKVG
jgi:hypothetical protein